MMVREEKEQPRVYDQYCKNGALRTALIECAINK